MLAATAQEVVLKVLTERLQNLLVGVLRVLFVDEARSTIGTEHVFETHFFHL